jgi:hypothetical protein
LPPLPAICPNGHVFPSGYFIEDVQDTTFVGNQSQCPICGRMDFVPDGIYGATRNTIQVVATSRYSREQLGRILVVLQQAQSAGAKKKEIAKALEPESPELAELVRRYAPRDSGALAGWLALIAMVVFGVMELTQSKPRGLTPRQTQQLVHQAVAQAIRQRHSSQLRPRQRRPRQRRPRQGRPRRGGLAPRRRTGRSGRRRPMASRSGSANADRASQTDAHWRATGARQGSAGAAESHPLAAGTRDVHPRPSSGNLVRRHVR